jgi:hypothetical protein
VFKVRRKLGGYAASWNDGSEFMDPDPFRAIELAAEDAANRLERSLVEICRGVREARDEVQGRTVYTFDELAAEAAEVGGAR